MLGMARNYGLFEICIFQMDSFHAISRSKINPNRWSKAVFKTATDTLCYALCIIVSKSRVSVAKNQFEESVRLSYTHSRSSKWLFCSLRSIFFSLFHRQWALAMPMPMHIKYLPQMNTHERPIRSHNNTKISPPVVLMFVHKYSI